MAVQIGAAPESDFDNPIGMLVDCHRRIEHFLHILCVVVERAGLRSLTGEETAAVEAAMRYFHEGGRRHTRDEEESLFPRLKAEQPLRELAALEQEHAAADRLHAQVDAAYAEWIRRGNIRTEEHLQLARATTELKHLYREHIRVEEELVFPHAASALNEATLRTMGEEFRQRRA